MDAFYIGSVDLYNDIIRMTRHLMSVRVVLWFTILYGGMFRMCSTWEFESLRVTVVCSVTVLHVEL